MYLFVRVNITFNLVLKIKYCYFCLINLKRNVKFRDVGSEFVRGLNSHQLIIRVEGRSYLAEELFTFLGY